VWGESASQAVIASGPEVKGQHWARYPAK